MPAIDSMSDDLPALCEPMTAIIGRSISACTNALESSEPVEDELLEGGTDLNVGGAS